VVYIYKETQLWEENENISQMNNNEKQSEEKTNDIILETKTALTESGCENIMPMWTKRCPKCNCVQVYATKRILIVATQKNKVCQKCRPRKEKTLIVPPDGWTRQCDCGRILHYNSKGSLTFAIKQKGKCNACSHIGKKGMRVTWSEFRRNCPLCNKEIFYSTNRSLQRAIRRNLNCLSCLQMGENNAMYGKILAPEVIKRLRSMNVGRHPTEETRKKMSLNCARRGVHKYGKDANFYGRRHSDETKRKMRIVACKRIMKLRLQRNKNGWINNVGKNENNYFTKMEKERGWNGIYYGKSGKQYFLEHLGYWVDYYEPNLNIVVEYDEPRHYRYGILTERDMNRMKEIKSHLRCQFWRYDEYKKCLVKF